AENRQDHVVGPPVGELEQRQARDQPVADLDHQERRQQRNEEEEEVAPARAWRDGGRLNCIAVAAAMGVLHRHSSYAAQGGLFENSSALRCTRAGLTAMRTRGQCGSLDAQQPSITMSDDEVFSDHAATWRHTWGGRLRALFAIVVLSLASSAAAAGEWP